VFCILAAVSNKNRTKARTKNLRLNVLLIVAFEMGGVIVSYSVCYISVYNKL